MPSERKRSSRTSASLGPSCLVSSCLRSSLPSPRALFDPPSLAFHSFCAGGIYAILAANTPGLIDAVVVAHPGPICSLLLLFSPLPFFLPPSTPSHSPLPCSPPRSADDRCLGVQPPSSWIFCEGRSPFFPWFPLPFFLAHPTTPPFFSSLPFFSLLLAHRPLSEDDSCPLPKQDLIIAHHSKIQPEGSFESHRYLGTVHGFASRPSLHVPVVKKVREGPRTEDQREETRRS